MKSFNQREFILIALLLSLTGFCIGRSGLLIKLLPWEFSKIQVEDQIHYMRSEKIFVYCTKTGECYHIKGCFYLKSSIQLTLKEAKKRNLKPCSVCHPPETIENSIFYAMLNR